MLEDMFIVIMKKQLELHKYKKVLYEYVLMSCLSIKVTLFDDGFFFFFGGGKVSKCY